MSDEAYAAIVPYLMVDRGYDALDFYKRAFGAEVTEQYENDGKLGHANLKINGGELMLSDEGPEDMTGVRSPKSLGGTSCSITLSAADVDAAMDRAVAAGAEVIRPAENQFYGRMGKLRDPFGHTWGIVGPAT